MANSSGARGGRALSAQLGGAETGLTRVQQVAAH
jgi:hypothetical protein